ncbi:hypothetical protein D1007_08930 [Hordeum vulgare]|nr:hypothetical protein D1007_08930 [Hordeum vulgare]
MDRSLPYNHMYGYDSHDQGPMEEFDEDGFTAQENEIFEKVTGKERGAPLFCDLSIDDKAVVDGGMRLGLFEPNCNAGECHSEESKSILVFPGYWVFIKKVYPQFRVFGVNFRTSNSHTLPHPNG